MRTKGYKKWRELQPRHFQKCRMIFKESYDLSFG